MGQELVVQKGVCPRIFLIGTGLALAYWYFYNVIYFSRNLVLKGEEVG
jgi:hypothetical protein